MNSGDGYPRERNTGLALGAILVVLGLLFLVAQLLDIRIGRFVWPFFVIGPGALILLVGLLGKGKAGEGLAILGTMVTIVGVLLFYMNLTGFWASWAYAWALVAPTGVGVGQAAYGVVTGRQDKIGSGLRVAGVGAVIFLVGAAFFELIIGINGFGVGRFAWPLLLIGAGLLWLVLSLLPRGQRTRKE